MVGNLISSVTGQIIRLSQILKMSGQGEKKTIIEKKRRKKKEKKEEEDWNYKSLIHDISPFLPFWLAEVRVRGFLIDICHEQHVNITHQYLTR